MICRAIKFRWLLVSLLSVPAVLPRLAAEPLVKSEQFSIRNSPHSSTLTLNGYLDSHNTYKHSYNIDVEQAFEPLRSLALINRGRTTIRAPRVQFNSDKPIYDLSTLTTRIFDQATTPKEQALALWSFFRDHRVHHRSPERGCEVTDPLKILGVYGYFTCGSASGLISGIGEHMGYPAHTMNLAARGSNHAVPEINFDDGFVIVDTDAQVFYLDYDNETLLGFEEVREDEYLIRRTHHFGKNRNSDFDVAPLYTEHSRQTSAGSCFGHSLDIELRPGESFVFDWSPAHTFHHVVPQVPDSIPWMVANSRFELCSPFENETLSQVLQSSENVSASDGALHPTETSTPAQGILAVQSPYTILDATLILETFRQSPSDTLYWEFSTNRINWQPLWTLFPVGSQIDSLLLDERVPRFSDKALYAFYLRFTMHTKSAPAHCRIDSLALITNVQTSRYNMPQLRLGKNTVVYSDEDTTRDLQLVLQWQESHDNQPPNHIEAPIFPPDNGSSDHSQFVFQWPAATDPEGDEIIDYEFQLSDRPDMRFPLSPTFDRYLSVLHDSLQPRFAIPYAGLLNHGATYYWRVRARDTNGAWGNWSDTWSFKVNTVMMPQDLTVQGNGSQTLLTWQPHSEGKRPIAYHIHGSSKETGFTPTRETFITEIAEVSLDISNLNFSSYRVLAVDEWGQIGGPSRPIAALPTTVESRETQPSEFALRQNSPNPFNAVTRIEYVLPQTTHVRLDIYNTNGQHIETLVNAQQNAGAHTLLFSGAHLPTGTYYYSLLAGSQKRTRRMILIR